MTTGEAEQDGKKKVTPEQAEGQATEAPAVDQAAKPDDKKKKVTPEQAEGQATEELPPLNRRQSLMTRRRKK